VSSTVSAEVCGYPEKNDFGSRTVVRVEVPGGRPVKALMYTSSAEPGYEPGDTLELTAKFRLADRIHDTETDYYVSRGIYLFAYADGAPDHVRGGGLRWLPVRLAKIFKDKISELFPADTAGFMTALLTGDRSLIRLDPLLTGSLQTVGMSHIVCVSGMHIAFLMGFLSLIIKSRRRLTAASVPLILFFMAFAGFTPSVCRAGIMQLFILLAPVFKREADPLTSLSAALVILLLFNPYSAASVGLQLSFAASLGLIAFGGRLYEFLYGAAKKRGLCKSRAARAAVGFISSGISSTLGALAFTVPLVALYFKYVSLIAPIANLLLLWLVSLCFCLGYVVCLIGFIFAPAGILAAQGLSLLVRVFTGAVIFLSDIPLASISTSGAGVSFWLVYAYMLLIVCLALLGSVWDYLYAVCAAAVVLCGILVVSSLSRPADIPEGFSVTALDVGQGQSVVLISGDCTAVVDCGSTSIADPGGVAADFLIGAGRDYIDLMVLSHYHSDHTNGLTYLASQVDIGAIMLPLPQPEDAYISERIIAMADRLDIDLIYVTQDLTVSMGDAELTLYAPLGSETENESCVIALCTQDDFDVLITADSPSSVEYRLLGHARLPDIELLVVGHHGSAGSTSQDLLDAVTPEIAVISVGENSYGHPARSVIRRLDDSGILVYRTDEDGTLTFAP